MEPYRLRLSKDGYSVLLYCTPIPAGIRSDGGIVVRAPGSPFLGPGVAGPDGRWPGSGGVLPSRARVGGSVVLGDFPTVRAEGWIREGAGAVVCGGVHGARLRRSGRRRMPKSVG